MAAEPMLAVSWNLADDGWVIKLRKGVKFHDGSEMRADDVVATIDHNVELDAEGIRLVYWPSVSSVEKIDDYTVKFITSELDPILPLSMMFLYVNSGEQILNQPDDLDTNPIGTGPYELMQWDRGQRIVLDRF